MDESDTTAETAATHLYDDFVDESGWTSMEPEGAGNHPHVLEEFPDIASQDRWDDDFGGQPGGDAEDHLVRDRNNSGALDRRTHLGEQGGDEGVENARGPEPVEGDGWGAPE
jgi:hypothetical protein